MPAFKETILNEGIVASNGDYITFSSIPAGYFALKMFGMLKGDYASGMGDYVKFYINGASDTLYNSQRIHRNFTGVTARQDLNTVNAQAHTIVSNGAGTSQYDFSQIEIQILNYDNTNLNTMITSVAFGINDDLTQGWVSVSSTTRKVQEVVTQIQLRTYNGTGFMAGSLYQLIGLS